MKLLLVGNKSHNSRTEHEERNIIVTLFNLNKREKQKGTSGIKACQYRGKAGVPVLFSKTYFPKLSILPDDKGAKKIIEGALDDTQLLPFPEGTFDIDTPEDVSKLNDIKK